MQSSSTWRQSGAWQGGTVTAIALSPHFTTDQILLTATAAGLYRSLDCGQSWLAVRLEAGDAPLLAVDFAPAAPGEPLCAFAATQSGHLYRTDDSGATWQAVTGWTGLGVIQSLAISPNFAQDRMLFTATVEGVFRTQDRGATWESSTFGLLDLDILALACAPTFAASDIMWACGAQGGFYRSRNGARSWRDSGAGLPDTALQCLAVSPNFGIDQTLYLGTEDHGLYRSTDSGATWEPASADLAGHTLNCLAISPNGQTLLAGTEMGLWRSIDAGHHWAPAINGEFTALTLALAENNIALAGAYQDGIFISSDGGGSWQPLCSAPAVHAPPLTRFDAQGRIYALDIDGVLALSPDQGRTWEALNDQVAHEAVFVLELTSTGAASTVFCATATHLYHRLVDQSGSATWRSYLLPTAAALNVLALSSTYEQDQMLLLGDGEGNLYRTTTGGVEWLALDVPWAGEALLQLRCGPAYASGRSIYAVTTQLRGHSENAQRYALKLWHSPDDGATWAALADFQSATPSVVLTAPFDPVEQPLFLATENRLIKLFQPEGESAWAVTQHFLAATVRVISVYAADSAADQRTLYVTTNQGVYISHDDGVNWRSAAPELAQKTIVALACDSHGDPILAVEIGGTVYARSNSR
ncbi:MAG: hypothetical protein R3C14_12305 [Caldilineaceae bacterium]